MFKVKSTLILKEDYFFMSKGLRAFIEHIDTNFATIQFFHPYNWNKNSFMHVPLSDLVTHFELAAPQCDLGLEKIYIDYLEEDRKGCFAFNMYNNHCKIGDCKSDGFSYANFTNSLDSMMFYKQESLINKVYNHCKPHLSGTYSDSIQIVQIEIALYLKSQLNHGAISFIEYFKLKQGHYLANENKDYKVSSRHEKKIKKSKKFQPEYVSIKAF